VLTNWQTGSGFAVGPNVGDFAGTTAIACCQAGGSILADDIATGAINHGLRIAFDYADLGGAAGAGPGVGPAAVSGHNDDGGGPGPLAEGMFLMVDGPEPGGLPYWGHQLWVTLATYGAWITDKLSGPPQIFGDGNSAQTDQFGFYSQMPWINTICKRLRATHRGF
jgi:hypothetical protein